MKLQDLFEANESQAGRIKYAENIINKIEAKTGKSFEKQVTGLYKKYLGGKSERAMEDRIGELSADQANKLANEIMDMAHGLAKSNQMKIREMGRGKVAVVPAK
jgi:hypothetical protein